MIGITNLKNQHAKKTYNGLLLILMCVFLAACGTRDFSANENDTLVSTEDSIYDTYDFALVDDNIPLLDPEKDAFLTVGELDKNLTASELREVQIYYKNYLHKSRMTIERFMYRALPYLAYTREVFRSNGLPEELAFLAFIESGYNPWAVSRANAVGMWQFMAPTGRHYGLVQDWWVDERRDPYKATHAAAVYLAKLYDDFGDWHLAIAAYNAGEGKIGRALKATGAKSFFELTAKNNTMKAGKLRLKQETIQYIPRYLAMVKIMRNFEQLGFEAEAHKLAGGKPMITVPAVEITAKPGTDLAAVAKELGMNWKDFSAYNPAFRRYITPPDRETKFYVPYNLQQEAILASKSTTNAGWSTYKIAKGDTFTKVSRKTGVPVKVLRQSNTKSEPLKVGGLLRVPGRAGAVNSYVASTVTSDDLIRKSGYTYKVRRGDTFGKIASRHKLSIRQLAAANPSVRNVRKIKRGQRIFIPSTALAQKSQGRTQKITQIAQISQKPQFHTIRRGETFYSISKKYGMSMNGLRKANQNLDANDLKIGQRVNLNSKNSIIYASYKVRKGDSFHAIARKHGISVKALAAANPNLKSRSKLSLGQKISVPSSRNLVAQLISEKVNRKPVRSSSSSKLYVVKKGDSFHSISLKHGLTQTQLASVNPQIKSRAKISIGQKINIPSSALLASASQTQEVTKSYTVKKGDTYWSISQRFGMNANELIALNKLNKSDVLSIGKRIKVSVN